LSIVEWTKHGHHSQEGLIVEVSENDISKFHGKRAATVETRRVATFFWLERIAETSGGVYGQKRSRYS
jgi:hypothetical protein